jgi:hypothetical protein
MSFDENVNTGDMSNTIKQFSSFVFYKGVLL